MPVVRSSLSRPSTPVVSSPVLPTPASVVTASPPATQRAAGRHSGGRDLFAPKLTDEQLAVRDSKVRALQVCAYAGTGKTATLVERANANPTQRILYVAFNKSIADEARRKFPGNVTCQTSHALAFRQFGAAYRAKLGTPGVRSVMAAVGVKSPRYASAVLACLNGWFASADREIHERHIPLHVVVRRPGVDAPMSAPHYEEVVHGAKVLWQRMQDKENQAVVMAHDGYFKLWSLSSPRLGYDAIYFDEAQDANPALTAVLSAQKHAGLTMVGDPFQSLYAFRGATNAMERSHYDQRLHLSQSFRFGPAVAEVASHILKLRGATLPLRGLASIPSAIGEIPRDGSYTRIGRTNSSIVAAAVEETARGRSLFFVGGIAGYPFGDLLDVYQLWAGQKEAIKNPDIQGFDDYTEYQETAEQAEDRAAIRLIKLVAQFGHQVPQLVERVQSQTTTDPRAANVTFATSHKAKGLEWSRVIIEDDFPAVLDNVGALLPHYAETNEGKQELNMLYVAATRAVNVLDLSTSASLREIISAARRRPPSVTDEESASIGH